MLNFQVGRISIAVGGSWWKGDVNRNEQLPECQIHDAEALFQSSVRVYGRKSFSEAPLQMRREMWVEVWRVSGSWLHLSWTMTINHDEDDDYDRLWRWLWSSKMNVVNPNNKPSSKSSFLLHWNHPQPGLPWVAHINSSNSYGATVVTGARINAWTWRRLPWICWRPRPPTPWMRSTLRRGLKFLGNKTLIR